MPRLTKSWATAAVLLLGLAGCTPFKRTPKAPPPPPPPQQPAIQAPVTPMPQAKPMEEPQLPSAPMPPPEVEPTVIRPKIEQVEPPKPAPRTRRRRATPAAKQAKPVETPTAPQLAEQPAVEPPQPPQPAKPEIKLAEVLTEEQRRDYSQTIDESLGESRRALSSLQGRTLTREQSENESRIRTFIRQAEEARETDIRASAQLSRRAVLLARELLDTLKK